MAVKFNKGDVAEGILASAMTARFMSKTKRITEQDVIAIIKKLGKPKNGFKGSTSLSTFSSPNENTKIKDTVICKINLAENNMSAFLDPKNYASGNTDILSIVKAAVAYANGNNVVDWANMMYANNQENKIEVNSEGLLDQTGTKVDLRLVIDGVQAGVGISLKAGDVKQFGQVGGSKFASMVKLWSPLGVKFSQRVEDNYTTLLSEKKVAPALTLAYTEALKQIQRKDQKSLQKDIAAFMDYHATVGEKDVVLIQLNRGEVLEYNFSNLAKKLKGKNITAVITTGTTEKLNDGGYKGSPGVPKNKIPKIEFCVDGKVLVSVRLKLEGNRIDSKGKRLALTVRSYIEKGPKTTELIGAR